MRLTIASKAPAAVIALKGPPAVSPSGDEVAQFADLYHQNFSRLFAYVYGRVSDKELALDIVADVFEKAFLNLSALRSLDAFPAWLFTIARNEVASHWRKKKPLAKALQEVAHELDLNQQLPNPEEAVLQKERMAALMAHLRQLSKREQDVLSFKFDAELTNREIAAVLGTSEVNVRVTLFRALRKLRERLQRGVA